MIVNPELIKGSVITSRIRLARNLENFPFKIYDEKIAKDIVKSVNRAVVKCDTFNLYYVSNMPSLELEAMKERHIISQNLIDNVKTGAVLVNTDETVSIMINEEDIIREQSFCRGFHLTEAYKRLDKIDDELSKNLQIAFDDRLGYLTACPTNLGTGLRASVMMFLPCLTESGKIRELFTEVSKLGLTIRGLYGEGSKSEGYMYQISNEVTLGVSEWQIIKSVEETVIQIINAEREEAERLYRKNKLKIMDMAKKSYGLLTNSVLLTNDEFLERISDVKFGAMMGVLDIDDIDAIDDLIVNVRPANLCLKQGKTLNSVDRDLVRAEIVGNKLRKLRG